MYYLLFAKVRERKKRGGIKTDRHSCVHMQIYFLVFFNKKLLLLSCLFSTFYKPSKVRKKRFCMSIKLIDLFYLFHFLIVLFVLMKYLITLALAFLTLVQCSTIVARAQEEDVANGSPGAVCYADAYNDLGNNWNHTYAPTEPQQIHMSLADDSKFARVQFATLDSIDSSVLAYWPKKQGNHAQKNTTITGKVRYKTLSLALY